ncbi:MAG: hypothetical protein ACK5LH_00895 [Akkermansiaceae bacterium]|jgi:hypothetical protein
MNTISRLSLHFELATQPIQFTEEIQTAADHELRSGILATRTKYFGVALAGAKFITEIHDSHLYPLATVVDVNPSDFQA